MIVPVSRRGRLSSSKKVNPYRACNNGFCRDFLCSGGYDLGTDILMYPIILSESGSLLK